MYLGKVQNVLPSMEAAFVDIGKGRNAVLYAGEVNFDASGLEGVAKRIESALKSGQSILVQVTKDPIGHKGARLTSQISLPGRYLVYVPGASMTGISRKLPDTERTRLKQILKQIMPENAGVIVRTAAEGASEEELTHDMARLSAQWEAIERRSRTATAPDLLYSEPDLTLRVVRDIFNEDFSKLVIASDSEWDVVDEYVRYVAPNLADRMERWGDDADLFAAYRLDEQLAKALDRKVWLPSGGSLVIDTTEAMTVIDVNTGKFTGQGGNLEQTVTRNNLEAAEEIVRQLRLRDVGGIIVIDFIDMVLESNRDLVLRRLIECLARDRTKHQVAEVTSLGLVQMTRKRVGSGLLEAFSVPCEHCGGRGVIVSLELADHAPHGQQGDDRPGGDRKPGQARSGRGRRSGAAGAKAAEARTAESTADGRTAESKPADGKAAEGNAAEGMVADGKVAGSGAAKGGAVKQQRREERCRKGPCREEQCRKEQCRKEQCRKERCNTERPRHRRSRGSGRRRRHRRRRTGIRQQHGPRHGCARHGARRCGIRGPGRPGRCADASAACRHAGAGQVQNAGNPASAGPTRCRGMRCRVMRRQRMRCRRPTAGRERLAPVPAPRPRVMPPRRMAARRKLLLRRVAGAEAPPRGRPGWPTRSSPIPFRTS